MAPIRLTRTMLEQLQSYVDHRDDPDRGGWYYGNREQFEKRHNTIKEWLAQEIERTNKGRFGAPMAPSR